MKKYSINLLGIHFIKTYKIDPMTNLEVLEINPQVLLTAMRLDLISKIRYVEDKVSGISRANTIQDYYSIIKAFSDGSFREPDGSKSTFNDYITSFNEIIDSIQQSGFNPEKSIIPVGKDQVILDGSHRVAAAIVLNKSVYVTYFTSFSNKFDSSFFISKGLSKRITENFVIEYLKMSFNHHTTMIIWPRVSNEIQANIISKIENSYKTVYSKQIKVSINTLENIIIQLYSSHSWVGGPENKFKGVKTKLIEVSGNNDITILTFEDNNGFSNVKTKLIDGIGLGNSSIHSSDNDEESLQIAELLYNANNLLYLNHGKSLIYPSFIKKIYLFKSLIKDKKLNNQIIIVSSSPLGLFGLRQPNDLDYLSNKEFELPNEVEKLIHSHKHVYELGIYSKSLVDYLTDNRFIYNFFSFYFYTLEEMIISNEKRKEMTKKGDVFLVLNLINSSNKTWRYNVKFILLRIYHQFALIERPHIVIQDRTQYIILQFLRSIGLKK